MKFKTTYLAIAGSLAIAGLAGCSKSDQYGYVPDKRVAQKITCVNNMKQIGLAIRIWEGDHGDQYPFNVSTNAGGTKELCAVGADGFDRNAYLHFQVMTGDDELTTPGLLLCPQDRSKHAATNWASLRPENVTYLLRTGTNVTDASPHEILAVCPIDGNILYTDGTVVSTNGKSLDDPNLMRVQ